MNTDNNVNYSTHSKLNEELCIKENENDNQVELKKYLLHKENHSLKIAEV